MNGKYPRGEEIEAIKNWKFESANDVPALLEYLEERWWMASWGFQLKGKRVLRLELHTGGWSGNEEIIEALQANFIFWSLFWERSHRGGHYWFRIDSRMWESPDAVPG